MNKNLNDILPPSRRRAMMTDESGAPAAEEPVMTTSLPPQPPRRPMKPVRLSGPRKFPIGTALIALLVIAASVGALFFFSGAKVAITPTESPATVSGTFTASTAGGELPFEVITVEKTATNSVPAESTQNVTQAAQGSITVSNTQDAPQQLIKNTRFETPDGLIFRIRESITVPAAKNGTAGSLSVTVYADEAGEKYNVAPTTFTLPGLSGTDTFTKVTARSTEAMKGGFAGARPSVSTATKEAESAKLQTALDAELRTALAAEVKEGYVLIPGATATSYVSEPDTAGAGGTVALSEKGTIRGVVFPEEAIARAIARQVVGTYNGEPLRFKSLEGLSLAPAEGLIPTPGETEFSFTLTGATTLVWKVDIAKIAAAVAGKSRDSADVILRGFPEVEQALLVLKPFWRSSFPEDPSKIDISVAGEAAGE